MFDHISKHQEESWKYDVQLSIFDKLWGAWKCDQTLSWVFDIYVSCEFETKANEKTEK